LPVIIGPSDRNELGVRFLIRHARNGAQTERPGRLRKGGNVATSPYSMVPTIEYRDISVTCQHANRHI
jgi:hypothetical protein